MSFDEELQRKITSAESAIEFEPGSSASIRKIAARRDRTRRVAAVAAALVLLIGIGSVLVRTPGRDDAQQEVAVGGVTEQPQTETPETETPDPPGTQAPDPAETETPLSGDGALPTEADFTYVGAFVLPAGDWGDSRFAFGGDAATFFADGDPDGDDDFTGSLFVSGHRTLPQGVAEVTIPVPASHNGTSDGLPIADVLRPFTDITGGRGLDFVGSTDVGGFGTDGSFRFSGLEVIDLATGPRLAWTIFQVQNTGPNIVPGHGHASVDLRDPDPQGPWFLGEYDSRATAGYLFQVPQRFADEQLDGNRLVTGLQDDGPGGEASAGPPFFAFTAPVEAEPNSQVNVLPLAFYDGEPQRLDDFGQADSAAGAEWITTSQGGQAVITVGTRGLGEPQFGPPGPDDCGPDLANHAGPYEPQIMFYDPADLARAATGELELWQLEPYLRWNPAAFLIESCEWELSSVSFDEDSGRLYVVQVGADLAQSEFSPIPVVHVFQL